MRLGRLLCLTLLAATAGAQKWEAGGIGGGGGFGAPDASGTYWVAGAEGCFFCGRRAALFAEYNHYGRADGQTVIRSADAVAGGLRVQARPRRIRPYFDIGIAGGQDHFRNRAHNLIGVAMGGGVAISLGEHWYVRPGVRLQFMSYLHYGLSADISLGFRFSK
jgi:hypothetical protein